MKENISNELYRVNNILTMYIDIHNKVFSFSLRKIIPWPFLFKKIDFETLYETIKRLEIELSKSLERISNFESDFNQKGYSEVTEALKSYSDSLLKTLSQFKEILYKLNNKAKRNYTYTMKDYKEDMDKYEILISDYASRGDELNNLIKNS